MNGSSIVSRSADVRWRQTLRGVLLDSDALDEPVLVTSPGDVLWAELDEPRSVDQLVAVMQHRFDGEPDRIRADIETLLDSLAELGTIERTG